MNQKNNKICDNNSEIVKEKISFLIDNLIDKLAKDNEILLEIIKQKDKEISELKSKNKGFQYIEIELETKKKRIKKYEKILHLTPGTISNKLELLEFFTEEIIPIIQEKIESKYTSKIKEFLNKAIINDKESLVKSNFYIYSHTMYGDDYPFYIGYSSNTDNTFKRSKNFYSRSPEWKEYVDNNGGIYNIDVKILAEINTIKAALELEKYYIRHYSENLVNKQHL